MSLPKHEDASIPCVTVPKRFCPRKLGRGEVKRYMTTGPLFGYYIGCPSCGFQEMHAHRDADFVESATGEEARPFKLEGANKPLRCLYCNRTISISGGVIMAVLHAPASIPRAEA